MGLINTAVANPNGQKPSPILALESARSPLRERSGCNADRVTNEIRPEKSEPQDQTTQRGTPDRVDPRGVIELADFDQESKS